MPGHLQRIYVMRTNKLTLYGLIDSDILNWNMKILNNLILIIRQFINLTIWQFGNSALRQFGNSTIRQFGNSTIRHNYDGVIHFDITTALYYAAVLIRPPCIIQLISIFLIIKWYSFLYLYVFYLAYKLVSKIWNLISIVFF